VLAKFATICEDDRASAGTNRHHIDVLKMDPPALVNIFAKSWRTLSTPGSLHSLPHDLG
jgi:hypothetical protein